MSSVYYWVVLFSITAVTNVSFATLNGYDLVYKPTTSTAPLAILVGEDEQPIQSVATTAFTICLFASLEKDEDLTTVGLFSFSSEDNDAANEIAMEVNYTAHQTNLYVHDSRISFSTLPPLREWAHICVSWESKTGEANFYVNGAGIDKFATVQPGYVLGGKGVFILGQSRSEPVPNAGIDPKRGVHGKLTQFNLWDRVLTEEEVKQVQNCNLDGNAVSWNKASWSFYGLLETQKSENPCGTAVGTPGCECNSQFKNLLEELKTELQDQLNEMKQMINEIGQKNGTDQQNITGLLNRTDANENDISILKQTVSNFDNEISTMKNANAGSRKVLLGTEQRSLECEKKISEHNLKFDECGRSVSSLEKRLQSQISTLKAAYERENNSTKPCPTNFIPVGDRCYYFSTDVQKDWNESLKKCLAMGASLLTIESKSEWDSIKSYLINHEMDNKNWWIGATGRKPVEPWRWVGTQLPFEFSDWCVNEPNNFRGVEHCGHIAAVKEPFNKHKRLCWNDYLCSNGFTLTLPIYYICKL